MRNLLTFLFLLVLASSATAGTYICKFYKDKDPIIIKPYFDEANNRIIAGTEVYKLFGIDRQKDLLVFRSNFGEISIPSKYKRMIGFDIYYYDYKTKKVVKFSCI